MTDTPIRPDAQRLTERYDTHVANAWVRENQFRGMPAEQSKLPAYSAARELLPDPFWSGHDSAIDCYWRAWELAFGNLKRPTPENDFCSNYCDTAFNGNLFMWDSAFITCFGGYGRRAFDFQKTLDNFYRKQHADGFICREISEVDGQDMFHRFDPSSTGPDVMGWVEWTHYLKSGDRRRLEWIFPPLMAYHQWLRSFHTWPDGSYWSTGWGSGMDSLPRWGDARRPEDHPDWGHGHMTWVDATFQAILSAKMLVNMAGALGMEDSVADLRAEIVRLTEYANRTLWNEDNKFYCDLLSGGKPSAVKHIGGLWALIAGAAPDERVQDLADHLENPAEFNRAHRVPALSADDPNYQPTGGYWCGGVWAPTNYMVIKGLEATSHGDLAHRIALNHHENVVKIYASDDTPWLGAEQFRNYFHLAELKYDDHHTLWEDYAADVIEPGNHSKPGYVGWTGIPPVAVLFEDIFGIVANAPENRLVWTVRLLEEHGVHHYPFGPAGTVDLKCGARQSPHQHPSIEIHSSVPFTVEIIWEGGRETLKVEPDNHL